MALFSRKKNKDESKEKGGASVTGSRNVSWVLRHPHLTEKAARVSEHLAYTFEIAPRATKRDVLLAIKSVYGVNPVKISVLPIPKKPTARKGRIGVKGGGKKAVVYLPKGSTIEFV